MTKTRTIDVSDLPARLDSVLEEVAAGVVFIVMREGEPVAKVSGPAATGQTPSHVIEEDRVAYQTHRKAPTPHGPLAQLVSAPAIRKVLSTFLIDPSLELHQREIARRAGAGLRSVQIALARLVELGLLTTRRDGNRLYYRAVRSERFEETRALLAREVGIAEVIVRHLSALEKPVQWAFIFGSAASGRDKVGSDIDLFVVTEADDDELVSPIADAQRELRREIDVVSYRPAEFAEKRAQGNHFISAVMEQQRYDLIGGDRDA